MNKHIRLVAELIKPWINKINNNNQTCDGIQCHLLVYLARSLNFTYDIKTTKDGSGYQLENGSWTGMTGIIERNVRFIPYIFINILLYNNLNEFKSLNTFILIRVKQGITYFAKEFFNNLMVT